MANINTANISYINVQDRSADPTDTPASDFAFFYAKSGGLYLKLDTGSVIGPFSTASGVSALDDLSDVVISSPTKGMLLVYNGTTFTTIAAGTNGYLLSAQSAQTTGLLWVTPPTAGTDDQAQLMALLGW